MNRISIALWVAILLSACSNTRDVAALDASWRLSFGYTGGATNVPVAYTVLSNRQLVRIEGATEAPIKRVTRRQMKKIRHMLDDMNFSGIKVSDRGNITYYISLVDRGNTHTLTWSDQSDQPVIVALYQELFSMVK